jgi:hypothetical protein
MKKCDKLYIGFRKFVKKKKLTDYDNEFFEKKTRTYKFMIPFIHKYINVEKLKNKLVHKDDIEFFKFFNVYANRDPKWIDEVKSMGSTLDRNFLFKDQDFGYIEKKNKDV